MRPIKLKLVKHTPCNSGIDKTIAADSPASAWGKSGFPAIVLAFCALWVIILSAPAAHAASTANLRVMTYNIRYDTPKDGLDTWNLRKEAVVSAVRFHKADILCIQEGLSHSVQYLGQQLGYEWFGVGRNDGKAAGEYSAIFYNPRRFKRLDGGNFWLSPTPEKPSRGWAASNIRIATWIKLKDKLSGRTLFVFNTHLDDGSKTARLEGTKLLMSRIQSIAGTSPVVLTGDFNSDEKDQPYAVITSATGGSYHLNDSMTISALPHHGPVCTFFGFVYAKEPPVHIDYIFVSRQFRVASHATLAEMRENGHFASDHVPVLAELVLEAK